MTITGPIYWDGASFPMQGGEPVAISETEFEDCCCDSDTPCTDCSGTQPAPTVTADACAQDEITDTAYVYSSFTPTSCYWRWNNDDYQLRVYYVAATSQYNVYIGLRTSTFGRWFDLDAPLSCVDGNIEGTATLAWPASDPGCFVYVTFG